MSSNSDQPPAHEHPLDNPNWYALIGVQQDFAEGSGLARRFRRDVATFGAIANDSPEAWADLATIVGPGVDVIINRAGEINPPLDWDVLGSGSGFQMVLHAEPRADDAAGTRSLTNDDVPEMMALIELTEPGPFRPRTIELGGYRGIFEGGRLLAMAGQRTSLDGYTEVSAVCTHPDGRRRGYAAAVTSTVARGIIAAGRTPILHVAAHNVGAKSVYERLGFETRTMLTFGAYRAPAA